jgi:hypothetical protein
MTSLSVARENLFCHRERGSAATAPGRGSRERQLFALNPQLVVNKCDGQTLFERTGDRDGWTGENRTSSLDDGESRAIIQQLSERAQHRRCLLSTGSKPSQKTEDRKQTQPGVCSTAASSVIVQKRLRRGRRFQWSDCIELMDGRAWGNAPLENVLRSLPAGNSSAR